MINVTWYGALAYTEWLSQQTGQTYRLPTEAEWEYACRAGTTTAYHFGSSINVNLAHYDRTRNFFGGLGLVVLGAARTVEVGRYPANAWGLHDMHGNISEWTCSVYGENYDGGEQRCTEPGTSDSCVLRGGSWLYELERLRGAARGRTLPQNRLSYVGIRLARTFP